MRVLIVVAALLLPGCVSTQMNKFVGQDVTELFIRYGQPIAVFDMPGGRRAFQFRYGGGTIAVPSVSRSTITGYGNYATVTTTGSPGGIIESAGCRLTFIGEPAGASWRIIERRIPPGLTC